MEPLELKFPPQPNENSRLFEKTGAISNIHVATREMQWNLYAEGYRQSALLVYNGWLKHPGHPEYLIFPIVFLHRHYIELRLKELIQLASLLTEEQVNWREKQHFMDGLWRLLRPMLQKIDGITEDSQLDHIQRLIEEFASRDPRSMKFRYPEGNDGSPHIEQDGYFDVETLMATMEILADALDATSMGLSCMLDQKGEEHLFGLQFDGLGGWF